MGDQKPVYQPQIISKWQTQGVIAHYHAVGWADGEAFAPKLDRISQQIDELYADGNLVSLVGVSAGAGAALNAYMKRPEKITHVVYICGKLIGYDNVNPRYFKQNPAFSDSLKLTQQNLAKLTDKDKAKMLSIRPLFDNVVPIKVMQIPGVKSQTIISVWHIPSIFLAITLYKRVITNFLNQPA